MSAVTICSDFRAQEEEISHYHLFSYLPWVMGPDAMILVFFLTCSFKLALSHSSFTLIKRHLSSSLLSAIRVVSSAYLRLFISSCSLFFFFNFIFKLYNIVLVLPNIKMNLPQVYLCSPSWTLFPLPSPYPPSGSSQCSLDSNSWVIQPGILHDVLCTEVK